MRIRRRSRTLFKYIYLYYGWHDDDFFTTVGKIIYEKYTQPRFYKQLQPCCGLFGSLTRQGPPCRVHYVTIIKTRHTASMSHVNARRRYRVFERAYLPTRITRTCCVKYRLRLFVFFFFEKWSPQRWRSNDFVHWGQSAKIALVPVPIKPIFFLS